MGFSPLEKFQGFSPESFSPQSNSGEGFSTSHNTDIFIRDIFFLVCMSFGKLSYCIDRVSVPLSIAIGELMDGAINCVPSEISISINARIDRNLVYSTH